MLHRVTGPCECQTCGSADVKEIGRTRWGATSDAVRYRCNYCGAQWRKGVLRDTQPEARECEFSPTYHAASKVVCDCGGATKITKTENLRDDDNRVCMKVRRHECVKCGEAKKTVEEM